MTDVKPIALAIYRDHLSRHSPIADAEYFDLEAATHAAHAAILAMQSQAPNEHGPHCSEYSRACPQCIAAFSVWKQAPNEEAVTQLDANGEAMICDGCGTTQTIAAILARHGPTAIACCPERKMVEARHFWRKAMPAIDGEAVERWQQALELIAGATASGLSLDGAIVLARFALKAPATPKDGL